MRLPTCLLLSTSLSLAAHAAATTVVTLPVGPDGIHVEGIAPEMLPWGPTALAVDPAGRFWIADAAAARLLAYAPDGTRAGSIALGDAVATIGDVEAVATGLFVLDPASEPAQVLRVMPCGERLGRISLPRELGLDGGLSGLSRTEQGEILVELAGGARLFQITDAAGQPLPRPVPVPATRGGAEVRVSPSDWSGPTPGRALVALGTRTISVEGDGLLGAITPLPADAAGAVTLLVEDVAMADGIQVDVTVRRYDAWGRVTLARVPPSPIHVTHPVALGPDGTAYALSVREDGGEIVRLDLVEALPRVLPAAPGPLSVEAPGEDACITRNTMEANAWGYRDNWSTLTTTNISGSCSGRTKPRYLGSAGSYRSVSYDWGGFDSVSGWRSYMTSGYKAGDINTAAVESCSKGVDCSGFVSRCWGRTTKYGTSTLPSISTQLSSTSALKKGDILNKAGSHVVLVNYITSSGVWAWEATTGGYDRVIYNYYTWSRYAGYLPRRYVNVCP